MEPRWLASVACRRLSRRSGDSLIVISCPWGGDGLTLMGMLDLLEFAVMSWLFFAWAAGPTPLEPLDGLAIRRQSQRRPSKFGHQPRGCPQVGRNTLDPACGCGLCRRADHSSSVPTQALTSMITIGSLGLPSWRAAGPVIRYAASSTSDSTAPCWRTWTSTRRNPCWSPGAHSRR